jgi:flagellar hook protein FlgE
MLIAAVSAVLIIGEGVSTNTSISHLWTNPTPMEVVGSVVASPIQPVTTFAQPTAYDWWPWDTGLETTDLAIEGTGWFMLREPVTDGIVLTRRGDFRIDHNGHLVNNHGWIIQGQDLTGDDRGLRDIRIPVNEHGGWDFVALRFEPDGTVITGSADGSTNVVGQMLLHDAGNESALERFQAGIYLIPGEIENRFGRPGEGGLGTIRSGFLRLEPESVRMTVHQPANKAGASAKGVLTCTSRSLDLGIRGEGFFLVRDPQTSRLFATRAGMFEKDADGYLITYDRLRVQGETESADGSIGDVRLHSHHDAQGRQLPQSLWVDAQGKTHARYSDGTEVTTGRIRLFDFERPQRLSQAPLGRFAGVEDAGLRTMECNGIAQQIQSGSIELIQVTEDLRSMRKRATHLTPQSITLTHSPTDLHIMGRGCFLLRDPRTGATYATRIGNFHLDENRYLVSPEGLRVQGKADSALLREGDLQIDDQGKPDSALALSSLQSFAIGRSGEINVRLSDGTEFVRGRVLIKDFREPFMLTRIDQRLFANLEAAQLLEASEFPVVGAGRLESEDPGEILALPPREALRFSVSGEPCSTWILQRTTDFKTWRSVMAVLNSTEEVELYDREPAGSGFYRILSSDPEPSPGRRWNYPSPQFIEFNP